MTNTFIPGHGKRTTLRDVAREAGVSIKTVSRVVNREPDVNVATAVRVAGVMKRLGYRPNELARSLKGQRSVTPTRTCGRRATTWGSSCNDGSTGS